MKTQVLQADDIDGLMSHEFGFGGVGLDRYGGGEEPVAQTSG